MKIRIVVYSNKNNYVICWHLMTLNFILLPLCLLYVGNVLRTSVNNYFIKWSHHILYFQYFNMNYLSKKILDTQLSARNSQLNRTRRLYYDCIWDIKRREWHRVFQLSNNNYCKNPFAVGRHHSPTTRRTKKQAK